jgi:hypothetical protein
MVQRCRTTSKHCRRSRYPAGMRSIGD